ncbi:MAG TPA: helix-turn-helix transcriptional regulator [Micromonospora sp.]|nr:helix-turn-helix transcriptional regulator [Micromonospora sp.]
MNPGRLTREAGRLLRVEREHAQLTQQALAERAGTSQQRISRFETGTYAPTTTMIERLFDALGLQIRLEIEARDADLDAAITAAREIDEEDVDILLPDLGYLLRRANDLRYLIDGELAAYLQGVPIQPTRFDLAVAEDDLPRPAALGDAERRTARAAAFSSARGGRGPSRRSGTPRPTPGRY